MTQTQQRSKVLLFVTIFVTVFGNVCLMNMPAPPLGRWNRAQVSLIDNGYRGLVLAIAEGVPEDARLIEEIKAVFTEASAVLYEATDHSVYFHELSILVPQSWNDNTSYQPAFFESFQTANILVNTAVDRDIPTQPFVKQPGICGEDGAYLHLTREVIAEVSKGDLARVIVHEWGHLRWGLFDEYPTGHADHFYLTSTGAVEPTRCSKAVTGDVVPYMPQGGTNAAPTADIRCDVSDNVGHLPDPRCRFQPHREQVKGATGSLMYAHYPNQITRFCHSNSDGDVGSLHNAEAPNRHNMLCNGRSAWDVMLTTPDFVDGDNSPREDANSQPLFIVKKMFKRRVVLVLDASNSMNDNRKFQKLIRASSFYLTDVLPKGTWVALVQFNATATVLAPLTEIRFKSSRRALVDKLPTSAGGSASIGAGVLKASEVLSANGQSPAGGVIIVMSDGLEATPPLFGDVMSGVSASGVIIDAMAYSTNIDENFHLPGSGDKDGSFFIPFAENDTIVTEQPPEEEEDEEFQDTEKFSTIVRRKEKLASQGNGTNYVHIDSSVGNDTVFRFTWEIGEATAVVRRPSGAILDPSSTEYTMDMEGRQVEIKIMGTAEPGQWGYGILNMNTEPQTMHVHVYSSKSKPDVPPLQARATIRQNTVNFTENQRVVIYGDVTQGELPVVRATVKALIRRPNDTSSRVVVDLFDLGTGADTTKDDGIYSAYFMEFAGDGVYTITLEVENKAVGQAKKVTFPRTLGGVMPPNWNNTQEPVLIDVEPFMRATQAVEFTVVSSPTSEEMDEDMFPPSRVTDLKVVSVSRFQGSLKLQWTAPGDDYDRGAAAMYDLRCSHSMEEMTSDFSIARKVNNSDIISGDLSTPRRSGSQETLSVAIPTMTTAESDLMLFLAFRIRAIDDAGLIGDPSNIATIVINYGDSPTTAVITSTAITPQPSSTHWLPTVSEMVIPRNDTTTIPSSTKDPKVWETLGKNMAIVLSVSVFLVLFSGVVLFLACRTRRRSKDDSTNGPTVSYSKARSTRRVSDAWVLEEV